MDDDVFTFALRKSLNEIANACPDIQSIFLFNKDGEIIDGNGKSEEEAAVHTVNALDDMLQKAEDMGGVQNIILEADKGRLNVSRINDFYLVTVAPEKTDMKYVNIFTNVLVPTVLKLLEEIKSAVNREKSSAPENEEPKVKTSVKPVEEPSVNAHEEANEEITEATAEETAEEDGEQNAEENEEAKTTETTSTRQKIKLATKLAREPPEEISEEIAEEITEEANEDTIEEATEENEETETSETIPRRILPEPQVNQFIVENVGGLFASADTVRIDNDTISQWTELYEDTKIEEATIETFGGKRVRCKVKPIKDSKFEGKGIVQVPEKIQEALEIRKGELVRVKPVIE